MKWNEYNKLFHELELNRVAFKQLMDCDQEVLKLVNAAIAAEREACCSIVYGQCGSDNVAQRTVDAIRARSAKT
jgi:hypothetical protein